jgi:hypothetical protein
MRAVKFYGTVHTFCKKIQVDAEKYGTWRSCSNIVKAGFGRNIEFSKSKADSFRLDIFCNHPDVELLHLVGFATFPTGELVGDCRSRTE